MSPEKFSYIVEQIKPYTDYIYLHVQGEPMMHPQFDEIMNICDREKMKVQLVTNGTYLKDHMNLLQHESLRKISFSLQSIEYQKAEDMHEYLNTILKFCEDASAQGKPVCELRFWRNDERLMPKTKFCISLLKSRYRFTQTDRRNNIMILPNVYIDYDNEFEWPTMKNPVDSVHGYCLGTLEQFAVLSNGNVVPCCLDAEGSVCFGNMVATPLKEILESGRFQKMKKAFQENSVREPLCQRCTYRRRFDS